LVCVLGVAAVACGDDDGSGNLADAPPSMTIDARPADAAPEIDAPPIDSPPPAPRTVTVTVTLAGVAAPGQTVYFQSADSQRTTTVETDVNGDATALVEAGGFVTVIEPEPRIEAVRGLAEIGPNAHLSTFAGVQPGDHLFVDVPLQDVGTSVTFAINVPDEEQNRRYDLYSTCGHADIGRGTEPPQDPGELRRRTRRAIAAEPVSNQVTLFGCNGVADLLVVSSEVGEGTFPRGWMYRPNVLLANEVTVDFTGEYQSVLDTSFAYTVSSSLSVNVKRELRTSRGTLYDDNNTNTAFPDGSSAVTSLAMPDPEAVVAVTTSLDNPRDGLSQQGVIDWGTNEGYELTIDTDRLRAFASSPVLDIDAHALTWTEAAEGATPDFAMGSYFESRFDGEELHEWTWRIVGPYVAGATALTYPVLPTTLFDFLPRGGDEPELLTFTTVKAPGGYGAARPRVFTSVRDINRNDPPVGDLVSPIVAGASGRIVFENMHFPPVSDLRRGPSALRKSALRKAAPAVRKAAPASRKTALRGPVSAPRRK